METSRRARGTEAVGVAQLRNLAASVGHDVYWAGPAGAGTELELTHEADGRIFVRYLSGDGRSATLARTSRRSPPTRCRRPWPRCAKRRTARRDYPHLPGGGLAYLNAGGPTSVYLAWPGSDYEVEVFDPSPKHALDLVLDGAIVPVR